MRVHLKGVHRVEMRLATGQIRTYYYAWRGGPRIDAEPGTPEFVRIYQQAHAALRRPKVGTMMSLSMVVMAICTNNLHVPMFVGIAVCVLVAVLGGLINGLLIAYANIPAFITTLGMLGIAQGLALKLSGGYSMYGFPDWYGFFGNGEIAGVPVPIWIVVLMTVVAF